MSAFERGERGDALVQQHPAAQERKMMMKKLGFGINNKHNPCQKKLFSTL
jgi:hypothetical protein